jgi:hypothetical protein
MCEVWKWLMIATLIPLVIGNLLTSPPFSIKTSIRRGMRFLPYRRFVWLDMAVFFVALVVYLIHCA